MNDRDDLFFSGKSRECWLVYQGMPRTRYPYVPTGKRSSTGRTERVQRAANRSKAERRALKRERLAAQRAAREARRLKWRASAPKKSAPVEQPKKKKKGAEA
jgi:hypothetical protein